MKVTKKVIYTVEFNRQDINKLIEINEQVSVSVGLGDMEDSPAAEFLDKLASEIKNA